MRTSAVVLSLTILRRIQYDIFESNIRRRQNCIDNAFICVNFVKKRLWWRPLERVWRQQRRLRKDRNAPFPMNENSSVLTATRTAGAGSVCKADHPANNPRQRRGCRSGEKMYCRSCNKIPRPRTELPMLFLITLPA